MPHLPHPRWPHPRRPLSRWPLWRWPLSHWPLWRRAILAGVLGLILLRQPAAAHAILETSEPAAGATIQPGAIVLKMRFNSRIDRSRSGLTMTRPDQTKVIVPIDPAGPPDILTATVTLTPGAYTVRWQVLAVDGHITRGDVPFTVMGH